MLDEALTVVADFVDLKSPYTAGHSRGVAALSADACRRAGLGRDEVVAARRAALVHDLGRTAIPNSIWDKRSSLTRAEADRVQLHPVLTGQMLRRSSVLDQLQDVAVCHHERANGSGYAKGLTAQQMSPTARIVAVADRYQAMTQERPHRPAFSTTAAVSELRRTAADGEVDSDAVECVVAAAGHPAKPAASFRPAGLTPREGEVMQLLTRGLTTKAIAARLVISPKTADSHIQHIYTKIGVSTRGAAALYTMQHGLIS
jgi:HD-GYP domain-containing protein (c-di-GMP phosphodiesterase class II)